MPQYRNPQDPGGSHRDRDQDRLRGERYQTSPDRDRFQPGDERRYQSDRGERWSRAGEQGRDHERYFEGERRGYGRGYEGDRRYQWGGYPEEFGHGRDEHASHEGEDQGRARRREYREPWGEHRSEARSEDDRRREARDEDRDEARRGEHQHREEWEPRHAHWRHEDRSEREPQHARWRREEHEDRRAQDWWSNRDASSAYIRGDDDWRSREASSPYIRGDFRGQRQRGYGEVRRSPLGFGSGQTEWQQSSGAEYFGTGRHYGGGYGTAPGTRVSGSGIWGEDRDQWLRQRARSSGEEEEDYGVPAYGARSTYLGDLESSRQGGSYDPGRQRRGEAAWHPESQQSQGSHRGRGPRGYERSDERLKELICERLTDDPHIDASDISIDVSQRVVKLSGTVQDRRTKYEVEDLVERCGGVKDIDNQLRVQSSAQSSAQSASSGQSAVTSTSPRPSSPPPGATPAETRSSESRQPTSAQPGSSSTQSGGSAAGRTGEGRGTGGTKRS